MRENRRTRKKILICDDNATWLEIFKFIFKRPELEVLALPDSSAILETARRHNPSLIILDIMMPGKDGVTALRELSGDPATAGIPVVVVSSVVDPETLGLVKKYGAREFVEKPFNALKLREVVRRNIAKGEARKD
jgi:CheY-like chemotaxis protein